MEIDGKSIRESKARDPWSCYGSYLGGGDALSNSLLRGFSWPPRSYTCSFCKREFRSAQALGGHMNVHRRDRARLRQSPVSPPWDSPVSNPRPDLNFSPKCSTKPNRSRNHIPNLNVAPSSCAISSTFSSVAYTFPSLLTPINCTHFSSLSSSSSSVEAFCSRGDSSKTKSAVKALVGNGSFIGFSENSMSNISIKKAEVVRLELDVGMHGELKEDLDLELRLGYT